MIVIIYLRFLYMLQLSVMKYCIVASPLINPINEHFIEEPWLSGGGELAQVQGMNQILNQVPFFLFPTRFSLDKPLVFYFRLGE